LNRFLTKFYDWVFKPKRKVFVAPPVKDQDKRLQKLLYARKLRDLDERNAILCECSDNIDTQSE